MLNLELKNIIKLTCLAFALYLLSFLGYLFPILNGFLFWLLLLVTIYLAFKKIEYGVLIIFFELILGAKGYLFSFPILGFVLSLRIALFAAVFLIWAYKTLRSKEEIFFAKSKLFPLFAVFSILLIFGMIIGMAYGNSLKNIFFDVNGYFYLALIFPLFSILKEKAFGQKIVTVLIAGSLALSIFCLYVAAEFTLFHQESRPDMAKAISSELTLEEGTSEEVQDKVSHSVTAKSELTSLVLRRDLTNQKPAIYRWTKDTSVAEISYLAGPFFRVFSPGQIYSLAAFIIVSFLLFKNSLKKEKEISFSSTPRLPNWFISAVLIIFFITILLGFSRSIWIGLLGAFIYFLFYLPWKKSLKVIFCGGVVLIIAALSLRFMAPQAFSLYLGRLGSIVKPAEESAGNNRLKMLPPLFEKISAHPVLGNGFGTTIEYESIVPEKYGTLRVFVFEWAYLDTLLKIGSLGLIIYLFFLFKIFKELGHNKYLCWQVIMLALLLVNITTPYLNHPLGIGLILMSLVFTTKLEKPHQTLKHLP